MKSNYHYEYVICIDGLQIAQTDSLANAKWCAELISPESYTIKKFRVTNN